MSNSAIILLTCCINPGEMVMTALTDVEERKNQYYESFDYYLRETDLNILIVENTNYTIDKKYLNNPRIEYLTFDGNNYDKERGKGYGELLIIEYALENSDFLNNDKNTEIIKITGRLKILSIEKHIKQISKSKNNKSIFADVDKNFHLAYSYFFVGNRYFFKNFFFKYREKLNDSQGFYFEHALARCIQEYINKGEPFLHLLYPIVISGFSGTTGKHYQVNKGLINFLKMRIKYIYFNLKQYK